MPAVGILLYLAVICHFLKCAIWASLILQSPNKTVNS